MEIGCGDFLTILAQLLSVLLSLSQRYHPSVSFRHDVGAVVVRDRQAFCSKLMPRYLRHRNFELFLYQVLLESYAAGKSWN